MSFNGLTKPVFLPPKMSFDSKFYIENVLPIVQRDGRKLLGDFVYQQDGARCHTSTASCAAMDSMGINYIKPLHWPANSPDLSPLDYFLWNEVEVRMKQKKYENREQMIKQLVKTFEEIPLEMIRESIKNFMPRFYELEKIGFAHFTKKCTKIKNHYFIYFSYFFIILKIRLLLNTSLKMRQTIKTGI